MTDALIMRAQSMIESTLSDRLDLRDTAILLVGSRAHARASETSDWDLLALASDNPPRETIELPRGEIELLGRDGRRARATVDLPVWQFELSHALLVHDGWAGVGAYCAGVATQFACRRPALAKGAWAEFRLFRNQAFASLDRRDDATVAITSALAARNAARAFLLWQGQPYPGDKWLLDVARDAGGSSMIDLCMTLVDGNRSRAERAQALGRLTTVLEDHMTEQAADWELLGDWWFSL